MTPKMSPFPLIARYSGSDLPAWRMNQTGVWRGVLFWQAARKAEFENGTGQDYRLTELNICR